VEDVSDDELIPLLASCNGSVREIADSVLTIAARRGSQRSGGGKVLF
jgi:hypothetical protein